MHPPKGFGMNVCPPLRKWGSIPLCPHCTRENIVRTAPKQKICGADACRLAAQRLRNSRS